MAPSRPLFGVPSSSIIVRSSAPCSAARAPVSAAAISPLTLATARDDALAGPGLAAVAQLDRLELAGRGAGGHRGAGRARPDSSTTSTSTVGLPRESRIWRAWMEAMALTGAPVYSPSAVGPPGGGLFGGRRRHRPPGSPASASVASSRPAGRGRCGSCSPSGSSIGDVPGMRRGRLLDRRRAFFRQAGFRVCFVAGRGALRRDGRRPRSSRTVRSGSPRRRRSAIPTCSGSRRRIRRRIPAASAGPAGLLIWARLPRAPDFFAVQFHHFDHDEVACATRSARRSSPGACRRSLAELRRLCEQFFGEPRLQAAFGFGVRSSEYSAAIFFQLAGELSSSSWPCRFDFRLVFVDDRSRTSRVAGVVNWRRLSAS